MVFLDTFLSRLISILIMIISVLIMFIQAILIASGSIVGKMAVLSSSFNTSVITGLQECTKFLISSFAFFIFVKSPAPTSSSPSTKGSLQHIDAPLTNTVPRWKYALPALLYSVANTSMFHVLRFISPAEFVLLWNTKIIFTALLHRIFLKKKLNIRRLFALIALLLGIMISEYTIQIVEKDKDIVVIASNNNTSSNSISNFTRSPSSAISATTESISLKVLAAIVTVFFALVVSFANVYTELIYKRNKASVWEQNMMLYGFGIICNVVNVGLAQSTIRKDVADSDGSFNDVWRGLNWWCLAMVLIGSCSGIITGLILKYIDVLFIVVADALAVVINVALSALLFQLHITFPLVIGAGIIVIAIVGYQLNGDENVDTSNANESSRRSKEYDKVDLYKDNDESSGGDSDGDGGDEGDIDASPQIEKKEWEVDEDLDQDNLEIGSGTSSSGNAEETDALIKALSL